MIKSYSEKVNKSKTKIFTFHDNQDKPVMIVFRALVLVACLFITYLSIESKSPFLQEILICEGIFLYAFLVNSLKTSNKL